MKVIKEEYKNKLYNFINKISQYCDCICTTGSNLNPYIENPQDVDVVCLIKKEYFAGDISKIIRENEELQKEKTNLKENYNVSVLIVSPNVFSGWYKIKFYYRFGNYDLLYGELPQDILEEIPLNSSEFVKKYIEFGVGDAKEHLANRCMIQKHFYHTLTALYFYINQKYELTEEQIENINIIHDNSNFEKSVKLINWAYDWLYNYKMNE